MLKLSFTNEENQFAIPREKYILKTNSSSWFGNHDLPWNGDLNETYLDIMLRTSNYKLNQMIQLKDYIVLLTLLLNQIL